MGCSRFATRWIWRFPRAAFSPVIAEADDRSDGLYDPVDGSLIAQGQLGLPVFVGTMQFSTRTLIEMIRDGRCQPPEEGDIYIVNDPYLGGTHLMDVRFAMPFYVDGDIFCWLSNTGHWPDIGGAVPGGFSANATGRRAGGPSSAAGQAFQARDHGSGDLCDHLFQYPGRRPADDRRHQGAGCSPFRGRGTASRSACPLRRRDGPGGDRRASDAGCGADARARLEPIPDGRYHGVAYVDSDGVSGRAHSPSISSSKRGTATSISIFRSPAHHARAP